MWFMLIQWTLNSNVIFNARLATSLPLLVVISFICTGNWKWIIQLYLWQASMDNGSSFIIECKNDIQGYNYIVLRNFWLNDFYDLSLFTHEFIFKTSRLSSIMLIAQWNGSDKQPLLVFHIFISLHFVCFIYCEMQQSSILSIIHSCHIHLDSIHLFRSQILGTIAYVS